MNNLTINEIHSIRKEHAISTQNMSFDEYRASLRKEVKPLLDLMKSMKIKQKKIRSYLPEIESSIVAEPKVKYHKQRT